MLLIFFFINILKAISLGLILLKSTINENDRLGGKRHLRPPTGGNLIIITSGFSKVDTMHPNRMKLTERVINYNKKHIINSI
jgi:hypothetical protein